MQFHATLYVRDLSEALEHPRFLWTSEVFGVFHGQRYLSGIDSATDAHVCIRVIVKDSKPSQKRKRR